MRRVGLAIVLAANLGVHSAWAQGIATPATVAKPVSVVPSMVLPQGVPSVGAVAVPPGATLLPATPVYGVPGAMPVQVRPVPVMPGAVAPPLMMSPVTVAQVPAVAPQTVMPGVPAAAPQMMMPGMPVSAMPAEMPGMASMPPPTGECGACDPAHWCDGCVDNWRLFGWGPESRYGIEIGGWINAGVSVSPLDQPNPRVNGDGTFAGGMGNGPLGYNYHANDFLLHQIYVFAERQVQPEWGVLDLGGRVDVLYGSDYIYVTTFGLERNGDDPNDLRGRHRWNSRAGDSYFGGELGIAVPQFYAEIAKNIVTVKVGHMYLDPAYESQMAPRNFFYSRSYAQTLGIDRRPMNAALGTLHLGCWRLLGGASLGVDSFDDRDGSISAIGGFDWRSPSGSSYLGYRFIVGNEPDLLAPEAAAGVRPLGTSDAAFISTLVFSHRHCNLTYVAEVTHGYWENGGGHRATTVGPQVNADWYGLTQNALLDVSECFSAGLRYEWYHDADAFSMNNLPFRSFTGRNAPPGHLHAVTWGGNYRHNANLVLRPEIRWDWFASRQRNGFGEAPGLWRNGRRDDLLTLSIDAVLRF